MSEAAAHPRKITVGVTGGVAAYRAVEFVRLLQQTGYDPHVAMTASAERFVTPLTFAAISGHRVLTSLWTGGEVPEGEDAVAGEHIHSVEHIQEAQTTGALVIVPASANVLAKLAHGLADDFLTTMALALPRTTPLLVAPAMNVVMWEHPAVQANVATLRARGVHVVEPGAGHLACGMQGSGRLAVLEDIATALERALVSSEAIEKNERPQELAGETVLITAGGTREPIDGVRFLGNRSSGRMGYALAEEALGRGARVLLIAANVALPTPAGAELVCVNTAAEMRHAVLEALPRATIVLKAAAVADFRPSAPAAGKLTRDAGLTLTLEPTEDIVAEAVRLRAPGTLIVAFAAEMAEAQSDPLTRAREKLRRKGVDAIVMNDVSLPGLGFDGDRNAGTLLLADGTAVALPPSSKREMAARLLDQVRTLRGAVAAGAGSLRSSK